MVGVPRSRGCALCVKRRVKCDQNLPLCGNCIKYGAECPGYEKGHKFVSVKHTVRTRGHELSKGSVNGPRSSSTSPMRSTAIGKRLTAQQSGWQAWGQHAENAEGNGVQGASDNQIPGSLCGSPVPFIHNIIGELFDSYSREEITYSAPWFSSLINYLGNSQALDGAMAAYLLQLVGKAKGDRAQVSMSRDLYGRSLVGLQRALNHPVAWKSAETLAATMLCCLFELFAGTSNPLSWMMHAAGVSKLVQARGPGSFSTPFERASLSCFRPLMVMQSLFSGQDCFLTQPRWQDLSSRLSGPGAGDEGDGEGDVRGAQEKALGIGRVPTPPWVRHQDGYFTLLAKVPMVLSWGYGIREERRHGITPDPSRVRLLKEQASMLRSEYCDWHQRAIHGGAITQPVEVPSRDPSSPFDTILEFSNPWVGSVETSYWATTLILQEALNQCYEDDQRHRFDEDNQVLATNILRATESVGRGIMGPYRISYALRIAYDFVDLPLKMWVLSAAARYSQQYAAVSTETYPRPNANIGVHSFMVDEDDDLAAALEPTTTDDMDKKGG